jgi:hypothetical protein
MRDAILKHMFISATSTDVIQAILVSIVWSQDDTVEARLFAGPAINIAVDLQLGQASERAINLQKLKKKDQGLSKEQSKELAEATNLARLVRQT